MGDDQLEQSPYELWEPRKTGHLNLNTMWQETLSPSVIPNIHPKTNSMEPDGFLILKLEFGPHLQHANTVGEKVQF